MRTNVSTLDEPCPAEQSGMDLLGGQVPGLHISPLLRKLLLEIQSFASPLSPRLGRRWCDTVRCSQFYLDADTLRSLHISFDYIVSPRGLRETAGIKPVT